MGVLPYKIKLSASSRALPLPCLGTTQTSHKDVFVRLFGMAQAPEAAGDTNIQECMIQAQFHGNNRCHLVFMAPKYIFHTQTLLQSSTQLKSDSLLKKKLYRAASRNRVQRRLEIKLPLKMLAFIEVAENVFFRDGLVQTDLQRQLQIEPPLLKKRSHC